MLNAANVHDQFAIRTETSRFVDQTNSTECLHEIATSLFHKYEN